MEPISDKRLDSSLINLEPAAAEPGVQRTGPAATSPPEAAPFQDQIQPSLTGSSLGGLLPADASIQQMGTVPTGTTPPELAAKLDTQLAMARLQEDARLQGEAASTPVEPPPEPASPTVQQAGAAVAAAGAAAAGDAEDVLNQMYERAQTILDSGFTRAEDILRFSEDAARQIEARGAAESGQILDTARQLAEQIRQRAYEEYQPPSIRLPGTEVGTQPPSIGLPEAGGETPVGEPSEWSDMLQDLFNKAMAEADDVWNRGQLDSARVLDEARALAGQTLTDGQQQATDVREAAIGASNRIHEFSRSISLNLRQEGLKFADMTRFREDLQRQDIRDDDFRATLQKELGKLEELLAERGKLR